MSRPRERSGRKPLRIALVGCGKIAYRHAEACIRSDRVELAALVDPVRGRAEELAQAFGIRPAVARHAHSVLHTVDAAIISAPNALHAELASTFLDSRVPVLVEKPLATSIREGEQICRLAAQAGAVAAVGYVTRFRESTRLMRDLIDQGYFGDVRRFAYQYGTDGGWSSLSSYTLDRRMTGGGVLVVTGSHFLDRLLYWFGMPDRVHLQDDSLGGPEANAFATFEYGNDEAGFGGTARLSKTVALSPGFVMQASEGTVILPDRDDADIVFRPCRNPGLEVALRARGDRGPSQAKERQPNLFQRQLDDFVEACTTHRPPLVPADEGLQSLRLIERLYASRTSRAEASAYASTCEEPALSGMHTDG